MLQLYHALVHPLILWRFTFPSYLKRLKTLQNRAIKIVASCHYRERAHSFYRQFKLLQVDDLWKYKIGKFVHYLQQKSKIVSL